MANTEPDANSSNETKTTYSGGCHCGLVKFTVSTASPIESKKVISCNCTYCHLKGYLLFYPQSTDVVFSSGEDQLVDYRFHSKRISHYFCPKCGTGIGGRSNDPNFFSEQFGINVRTLQGVDIDKLDIEKFDGKNNPM